MRRVVHKPRLLPHSIPHTQEEVVHRGFHSDQVGVAKRERSLRFRFLRVYVLDRVFDHLVLVFREREPAQLVRLQRDLIDRAEDPADRPVLPVIGKEYAQELKDEQGADQRRDDNKRYQAGDRQKQGPLPGDDLVDQIHARLRCRLKAFQASAVLGKDRSERRILLAAAPPDCHEDCQQKV